MARNTTKIKQLRRSRIHKGIRRKIRGTAEKPRLAVYRSNKEIYAQIIDDIQGHTLVMASSRDKEVAGTKGVRTAISAEVGKLLASRAAEKKIETVVFDRGGYLYHGRVKALADGAREGGLKF